jgi:site-specific recombinase XerC
MIQEQFGIQGAQATLGHSEPNTTAIYAERDFDLVAKIMKQVG